MPAINWYPKVKENHSRLGLAFHLAAYVLVSLLGLVVLGVILAQFAS